MRVGSEVIGGDEKNDDPSWLEYSMEMREGCISDVSINVRIYRYLIQELVLIKKDNPIYGGAVELEHKFAQAMAEQEANGWLMDLEAAQKLLDKVNAKMLALAEELEPQLLPRKIMLDKEPRAAKILKNGK